MLRALADDAEVARIIPNFLDEGTRELLLETGKESFAALDQEELQAFQRRFFAWKRDREASLSNFMVDRSFVDVAAVWRERDTLEEPEATRDELLVPCRALAEQYTLHILVPPFGNFVDDGVREPGAELHERISRRIVEYLADWRLDTVTLRAATVEARVAEIRTALGCVGQRG